VTFLLLCLYSHACYAGDIVSRGNIEPTWNKKISLDEKINPVQESSGVKY